MRLSLLVPAFLSAALASAQSVDTGRVAPYWASGISFGVPAANGEIGGEYFTIGAHFTRMSHSLGADIAVITVAGLIPEGLLPVAVRFGVARPISLDGASYLVPSAGLVGLGVVAADGGGGTGGYYAGLSFLSFSGPTGLRIAYTVHGQTTPVLSHLEIGFVRRSLR